MKNSLTLDAYLERVYLPSRKISKASANSFRAAVNSLVRLFGRKATRIDLVTPDQLERYRELTINRGRAKRATTNQFHRLRAIMRHARPEDFPQQCGRWRRRTTKEARPVDEPGTVWHHYVSSYKPERFDCSPGSLAQMEHTLASLFRWRGGGLLLADLTDKLLVDWATWLMGQGRKPNTIRGYVGRIETLWRDAHHKGLVAVAPNGRRRKRTRALPEAWTLEEFAKLIEATSHPDLAWKLSTGIPAGVFLRAVVMVAYDTGFRRGDLFALRKTDLREDGVITIVQGKTGLPITRAIRPSTMAAVRAAQSPGELLIAWPHWDTTFYELFRKLLTLAGLSVHRRNQLQKIRRTTASYAEREKPGAASLILGHRDPSMAARHYIDPKVSARAPELPPDLLKGGAA